MPAATLRALAALLLTAGMVAACSGCGSSTQTPGLAASTSHSPSPVATPLTASRDPSAPTAGSRDCPVAQPPVPSSVDGLFTPITGYTIVEACASDVDSSFAHLEEQAKFAALTAAFIEQNGTVVLRVIVGQLNSGTGDAYVDTYLSEWSTSVEQRHPSQGVATSRTELGGYQVTYFNIPLYGDGYLYTKGSIVVIAFIQSGGSGAAKDALPMIFANLP